MIVPEDDNQKCKKSKRLNNEKGNRIVREVYLYGWSFTGIYRQGCFKFKDFRIGF